MRRRALPLTLGIALLFPPLAAAQDTLREGRYEWNPIEFGSGTMPELKPDGPFRLQSALGLPAWLIVRGQQRTRFESMDHQFRKGTQGNAQLFSLRTDLQAMVLLGEWAATVELLDARQIGADDDVLLSTGIVNALEPVQYHLSYRTTGVLAAGDQIGTKIGRFTQDLGSRRFVAHNRFRNTVNTFDGAYADWQDESGTLLQAFYTLPVLRLPVTQSALRDNDVELDETRTEARFAGLHLTVPDVVASGSGELFVYRLDEDDGVDYPTRNRKLWTLGARWNKNPKAGEWHGELEGAYQFGDSRKLSASSDLTDLDHEAYFAHLDVGYTFDSEWRWMLEGMYDYASGDADPNDGKNGRFDTLYGIPRPDFGPTSVFGPFQRANLNTPGYRLACSPTARTNVAWLHRLVRLAEGRDSWVGTGLEDTTGGSGSDLGQIVELRVRQELVKDSAMFEIGVARLFAGSYQEQVPGAPYRGDVTYFYTGLHFKF